MTIPIFAHVAAGSFVIPAAVGLRYWRSQNFPMKIFIVFCIYSVFHLAAEFTLGRFGISNQFLSNYHQIVELVCILYVYHQWIDNRFFKRLFISFGIVYCLVWLVNKFFYEDPERFSEMITTIALLFLIVSSVIVMNGLIRTSRESIFQHSIFWIALGVLLYSAGTIVVTSYSNEILAMGILYFNILWHINWGFTIIANIMYSKGLLCKVF